MKYRYFHLQVLLTFIFLIFSNFLWAQPSNDDCSTPTSISLGLDSISCVPIRGDTRGTIDATQVTDSPTVCSGSWFTDDVWFSVETGEDIPPFGITIEVRLDTTSGTELIEQGMAIYKDCDSESIPIDCFSDNPGVRTMQIPTICIEANSNYLIRIWSAPGPRDNEGTFSICAYETPEGPTPPPINTDPEPRVIYEENFDEGFNGWISVAESTTPHPHPDSMDVRIDNHWVWSENACIRAFNGGANCLHDFGPCIQNGAIGIPAGFYSSFIPPCHNCGPFLDPVEAHVISPPIDLSNEECVMLTWIEAGRFLNGGDISNLGPFVQYSLDNGEAWLNPSDAIGTPDVAENYGGNYVVNAPATREFKRTIPLLGAEGNPNVRIRFGFESDFYFWIIDDVKIIASTISDANALDNTFTRATINPMSIHMIDPYDFAIDISNLACEDLTNLNANMTIVNSAGDEVHNVDLEYGTLPSDSIVRNIPFSSPFTPDAIADEYNATYTVTADRDDDSSNNIRSFQASVVDEMQFRKEDGIASGQISPNINSGVFWGVTGDPAPTESFNWEIGNIFFAPNDRTSDGELFRFNEINFQLGNPEDIVGDSLVVSVYKIEDHNFDNIIFKDDQSEITKLGEGQYNVTGLEDGLISVALNPVGIQNPLIIERNTHYIAAIENTTNVIRTAIMSFAVDNSYDYTDALENTRLNANGDLTKIRYGNAYAISKQNYFRIGPGDPEVQTSGNFPEINTPIIRLGYEVTPSNSTIDINKNIQVELSPNPTATHITVDLSIKQATDMDISIVDLSGSIIVNKSFNAVTELREDFNLNALTSGVYFVHINTKNGVQTRKFVLNR